MARQMNGSVLQNGFIRIIRVGEHLAKQKSDASADYSAPGLGSTPSTPTLASTAVAPAKNAERIAHGNQFIRFKLSE